MSIRLTVSEFGAPPEDGIGRPAVRLNEVSAKRFFLSSPEEFFQQYASVFRIESLQSIPDALAKALDYASAHPEAELHLQTLASNRTLSRFKTRANALDVAYTVEHQRTSRVFQETENNGLLIAQGFDWMDALARAGLSRQDTWGTLLQRFIETEARGALHLRKDEAFETFLRAMAAIDGLGVNWNALARQSGISQPRAKLWGHFLAEHGLVDLIGAPELQRKHRIVRRETVYWNAPGLANWLSGMKAEDDPSYLARLRLNALYLHLKDQGESGTLFQYRDTNGVTVPLIRLSESERKAFCLCESPEHLPKIRSHLRSVNKVLSLDTAIVYTPEVDSNHGLRLSAVHFSTF